MSTVQDLSVLHRRYSDLSHRFRSGWTFHQFLQSLGKSTLREAEGDFSNDFQTLYVREEVLRSLPAWAKPETDSKGNVTVTVGNGGDPLLFVAHMDEVGFRVEQVLPPPGHEEVSDQHEQHRQREEQRVYRTEVHPHLAPVHVAQHEIERNYAHKQAEGDFADTHGSET